jgi:uncharacterized membrane protein
MTVQTKSEKTNKNFGIMKDGLSKEFGLLHNEEFNSLSMNISPSCVRIAKYSRPRLVMVIVMVMVTRVGVKKNACTVFFV